MITLRLDEREHRTHIDTLARFLWQQGYQEEASKLWSASPPPRDLVEAEQFVPEGVEVVFLQGRAAC